MTSLCVSLGLIFMAYTENEGFEQHWSPSVTKVLLIGYSSEQIKGGNMCSLYLNPPLCDVLTSKSVMYSKGRPSRQISDVCSSKSRGELKVSITKLLNRSSSSDWKLTNLQIILFLIALIRHSKALMHNVHHRGDRLLRRIHFFPLFPVDFERFNLPHQWGNPPRCVELRVDWVQ